jgi:CheY-like chemotaxis protein
MPVCNGYDATKHIRISIKNDKVVIIALTADSTNAAKRKCIAVGMNDYFTKPITTKTLEEMLYKWLITEHNDGEKKTGGVHEDRKR